MKRRERRELRDQVFIHVGLMKTATSMPQTRVFPQHRDLTYLGGPEYKCDTIRAAIADISKQDRLRFDAESHRQQIRIALSEAARGDKPIVISSESLTTMSVDRLTKAERLREVFGDIRIVLCLRRPEDLLISLYSQYLKEFDFQVQRMLSLDEWLEYSWSTERAQRVTRFLDFSPLIRGYHSVFSAENVCVLLFEDLQSAPDFFAQQLSDFIGVNQLCTFDLLQANQVNVRVSRTQYSKIKLQNLVGPAFSIEHLGESLPPSVRRLMKWFLPGSKQLRLSDIWRKRVRDYSLEVNTDLDQLVGDRPHQYDYF